MADIKKTEHYAYFKHGWRTNSDTYDTEYMDYTSFEDVEEMKSHYQRNKYNEGTYVKIIPVKFETTVKVVE